MWENVKMVLFGILVILFIIFVSTGGLFQWVLNIW